MLAGLRRVLNRDSLNTAGTLETHFMTYMKRTLLTVRRVRTKGWVRAPYRYGLERANVQPLVRMNVQHEGYEGHRVAKSRNLPEKPAGRKSRIPPLVP
jgi:hypothetical protein